MMVFKMLDSMVPAVMLVWGLFLSFILSSMSNINIASLNVNGARDSKKRAEIYELVKQKHFDVVLLQETHSDVQNEVNWAMEWDGLSVLSHNNSLSAGVAVLFSKNFTPVSYEVDEIIKGRILKIRAVVENQAFIFMCVYAPTATIDRIVFFRILMLGLTKM